MYVKVTNGNIDEYPCSIKKLIENNPSISARPSDSELAQYGVFPVVNTPEPEYDPSVDRPVWGQPAYVEGRWVHVWQLTPLTQEEKENRVIAQKSDVRYRRNKLLQESDWTQIADAPIDGSSWRPYRQALRDITTQEGFPWDITWPTKPE